MEDDGYVRALWAILANPMPTGIDPSDPYGQADDGIDRYDGFGRDVWVESLQVTEGDHGAELEVSFALAFPPDPAWLRLPNRGSVRLPFDRHWRQLSGYEAPSDYAPEVARKTMSAAHQHVTRHQAPEDPSEVRNRIRAALPNRDVQWQMLLDALNTEGRAVEVSPGRVEVQIEGDDDDGTGASKVVTVVATPGEWEEVLVHEAGVDAELYVAELLAPRDADERFVVFYDGDLARSTREELPPVRGRGSARKLAEIRARQPDGEFHWSAFPPEEANDPDLDAGD